MADIDWVMRETASLSALTTAPADMDDTWMAFKKALSPLLSSAPLDSANSALPVVDITPTQEVGSAS